ncbi:MAG TPA: hypothetical protein VF403_11660 [Kofleriaceae bacterium]
MRSSAAAEIINLDEYRSRRPQAGPRASTQGMQAQPVQAPAPTVWVYWVPVWVW